MIEKVALFGADERLMGILSAPERIVYRDGRPAVIILNAGLLHKVGPYRMHVDLARELAGFGFYVFRFDISGIGDSEASTGCEDYESYALNDTADAMDWMSARTGTNNFVIIGLCSGADNMHRIGVRDTRVAGGVLIDAYGYPTPRFKWHDYGPALLKPHKWAKQFRKLLNKFTDDNSAPANSAANMLDLFGRNWPTREIAAQEILAMVERNVKLLYIYSGGAGLYYNYRNQFWDMFKPVNLRGKVHLECFRDADHTFTLLEQRRMLIDCICSWMTGTFG